MQLNLGLRALSWLGGWLNMPNPRQERFKVLTVVALLLTVVAAGCGGDDSEKSAPPKYLPKVQEWQQTTGIACASVEVYTGEEGNADNSSGNVCRVMVNGRECVAILPDDDTSGDYPDNLIHCPKGSRNE